MKNIYRVYLENGHSCDLIAANRNEAQQIVSNCFKSAKSLRRIFKNGRESATELCNIYVKMTTL